MASGNPQRRQYQDVMSEVIPFAFTVDPASIAAGAELSGELTVTGAALGDFVRVAPGVDVTDLLLSVTVTAADTVTWVLMNETAGAIDLASSQWNGLVEKPSALITSQV